MVCWVLVVLWVKRCFLCRATDPDITRGDGIYSRYLPPLQGNPGRYLLTADIDYNSGLAVVAKGPPTRHHKVPASHLPHYYQHSYDTWSSDQTCCGYSLSHVHTRRAAPFLRHVTWGVLEVVSPSPARDVTPPSRILDLRVEVNDTVHEITLRWTAPGDDWDVDRAHHYEAVVAPLWREARAFQGDHLTGLPQPLPAGAVHTTNLHFVRYEEVSSAGHLCRSRQVLLYILSSSLKSSFAYRRYADSCCLSAE